MSHNSPNTGNQYTRVAPGKIIGQDNQSAEIEKILTKLENSVEHDIKMRRAHQPQRLVSPKQVHHKALKELLALSESRAIKSYQNGYEQGKFDKKMEVHE